MMMKKVWLYTVTWFEGNNIKEAVQGDPHAVDFKSLDEALAFYNEHCTDENIFFMHVAKLNLKAAWEIEVIA